ncbi:hypothetical protein SOVF_051940 isoform D [Spinacia oleracea]|nr:hypothetical protein SOVF_051940 isoform D [Spinacia oleracea]
MILRTMKISKGVTGFTILYFVLLPLVLTALFGGVNCQGDGGETDDNDNPAAVDYVTQVLYERFANSSSFLTPDVIKTFSFCIKNVKAEWDSAFDFSRNLSFLSNCILKTKGDLAQRLCTAAEIKYYFTSFRESGSMGILHLKLNRNCNMTTWLSGCQPGWACSVGHDQNVNYKDSTDIPDRTDDCQPCCEGFFCPHGLTCMIPCPLGSYCPLGSFNKTTGVCDPYHYQLPQGQPNHSCGGADVWADIDSSGDVFCPAGSYCPSTVEKEPCNSGHYCRTGSTSQSRCITTFPINEKRLWRLAKFREAAAKSARETAQARDPWKSAKDVAKHAFGLQKSLSQTFSRRKSAKQEIQPGGLRQDNPETDGSLPVTLNTSNSSQDLSIARKGKKPECSDLQNMMIESAEDHDGHKGFKFEIGDKNLKNVKANQYSTHSQIFKYAYGQIEKEKAMQEQTNNLTFSGMLSVSTDIELRKRPTLEVAFQDLTLTLKGKKKHLLRCVTGKISPGRVSAVMGPSGAGKTTFLSALAGKATGCKRTGMILINGKADSTHSYKRIIGFVPQDDIVHGNLTVEENLWFSARCRLSADLSKAEKVLVLERVIESLGLQTVRDCIVGTVEKRGISGGQRKRVNVGLEMVMEPSLLILDEPTSGLDSSSSLLLLRALRREALEGVNICMVVHQPSYALYTMFDVLILLAKGGLIAYLGPAKKVEEYFSGLGITVPERVNPPDHFIDILEGVVKPNSDVNYRELPIRWMLHNGYPVPLDLQSELGIPGSSQGENSINIEKPVSEGKSFAKDLWQDMKCNIQLKKDHMLHNILKMDDQSNRVTPGIFQQYRYFLGRVGKQRLREARIQAVDYLILLLAGACLGTLAKVSDETFGVVGYTYTVIAVSLLCKIAALRSFALDKLHYWRESDSGMSSLALFLAKDTIDQLNTIVKPLVYLSMFYFFNNPRSSILENYVVLYCLVYCVTGIAYILAIFFAPGPAQLWSVLLPVVLTLIATQENGSGFLKRIQNLCYTKWALEAFVIANAQRYSGVWLVTRCGALYEKGYDVNDWWLSLCVLIATGVISRIAAFNFMLFRPRSYAMSSSLATATRMHLLPVIPENGGKKNFGGQHKILELQREVSVLQNMLNQEEQVREVLQQAYNRKAGMPFPIPDHLPSRMKELLSELVIVEDEIVGLETQIEHLRKDVKTEQQASKQVKSTQLRSNTSMAKYNQQRGNNNNIDQQRVGYETRALHFISKAINGDYSLNDFTINENDIGSPIGGGNLSPYIQPSAAKQNGLQDHRMSKRNGVLNKPSASPLRSFRDPTPFKPKERSLEGRSDPPKKSISGPTQLEESNNGTKWQPNKLSENIMKCLILIYVRLIRISRQSELEKSGPISRSMYSSSSFRTEPGMMSLSTSLIKESKQQDPFGIFDIEGAIPRDIGPYKNLVVFSSTCLDPKFVSNSSSIPLFQRLKGLFNSLQKVDLKPLTDQQKLAFWINIYNACIMHGFLKFSVPSSPEKLLNLLNKATLNVGGKVVNAQAIERCILRKPTMMCSKDGKEAIIHELYGLHTMNPNVIFTLCCGTRSSPAKN